MRCTGSERKLAGGGNSPSGSAASDAAALAESVNMPISEKYRKQLPMDMRGYLPCAEHSGEGQRTQNRARRGSIRVLHEFPPAVAKLTRFAASKGQVVMRLPGALLSELAFTL